MKLENIDFNKKEMTISKAFENALWLGIFAQTLDQLNRSINLSKQFANMLTIEEVKEIKAKVEKQSKESGK
tara:strand:+ start:49 stop:261 length:213 start_codon:yes stop_codon:yes gene_type:complete